jgi:hypothetical protein
MNHVRLKLDQAAAEGTGGEVRDSLFLQVLTLDTVSATTDKNSSA